MATRFSDQSQPSLGPRLWKKKSYKEHRWEKNEIVSNSNLFSFFSSWFRTHSSPQQSHSDPLSSLQNPLCRAHLDRRSICSPVSNAGWDTAPPLWPLSLLTCSFPDSASSFPLWVQTVRFSFSPSPYLTQDSLDSFPEGWVLIFFILLKPPK